MNFFVDVFAAACLLGMMLSGYVLRFPLPPGTNRTHTLWGLSRHDWGSVHFGLSVGLVAVLFVHLAMHWDWILCSLKRRVGLSPVPSKHPVRAGWIASLGFAGAFAVLALAMYSGVREREVPLHPLRGDAPVSSSQSPLAAASPSSTPAREMEPQRVEFWKHVFPVFEENCLGCHGPAGQRANFRADRKEDFFRSDTVRPLVRPGDSAASRLIAIVAGELKGMKSYEAHKLDADAVATLRAWIDQGAEWPVRPGGN